MANNERKHSEGAMIPGFASFPMESGDTSRRQFLAGSVSGLSSAWVALHWPVIVEAHKHAREAASLQAKLEFFSPEEAREVEAIAAQIIPTDETPSAREAGVIYFIDRALTTFDRDRQAVYREGVPMVQSRVTELFLGSRFSGLSDTQQIQVLTAIEKTEFFETVRVHTVMGFLSDPSYGGNRDQQGWKLIGFEQRPSFKPPFGYYDSEGRK